MLSKVSTDSIDSPSPRSSHSLCCVNNDFYIFGGEFEARNALNSSLFIFDGKSFKSYSHEISPSSRLGHTTAVIGSKIYLFGGRDSSKNDLGDIWCFDTLSSSWNCLEIPNNAPKPEPRSYHAMESIDQKIYIFGGCGYDSTLKAASRLNDLWVFDPQFLTWEKLSPEGDIPCCRGGPALVKFQTDLYLLFGFNGEEIHDCWKFSICQNRWFKLEGVTPNARSVFGCCSLSEKGIFLFGGEGKPSGIGHLGAGDHNNDTYIYNPLTNVWTLLPSSETTPIPRGWHACAYSVDASQVFLFGGLSNSNERLGDAYVFQVEI